MAADLAGSLRDTLMRKVFNPHRRLTGFPPRLVTVTLLGRTFTVREGTARRKVDYDDAWLYCAAKEARVIWDIGCNMGQTALLMLLGARPSTLLLLDPNADALSVAADNMIRNGYASLIRL